MFSFHGRSMLLFSLFTQDQMATLSNFWIALVREPVLPADTGETITEVNSASYVRVGYGVTSEYWKLTAYGELSNAQPIYWPAATDTWGAITGWALTTEPIGGLVVCYGTFWENIFIDRNGLLAVSPGMLTIGVG